MDVTNLVDMQPVSRTFGFERGTPIDRYYIERFLSANERDIAGRTLEIASASYTTRFGSDVSRREVMHAVEGNSDATIVGDLTHPATLPGDWIDCFVCTQTLHCIFDVRAAVQGIQHILRPGGVALVTLPGISQITRFDMDRWGDYWRFTTASAQALFEPVFAGGVEVTSYGNRIAAVALLNGLVVEDMPDPALLDIPDDDYQVLVVARVRK